MSTTNATTHSLRQWAESIMGGYTEDELSVAFDAVKNTLNWKLPISTRVSATVTLITRDQIARAIDFYAGGGATFTEYEDGSYLVQAPGYYEVIGA